MQDRSVVKDHLLTFVAWLESNNLCLGGHQENGRPHEWLLSCPEQQVAIERFLIETFEGKPPPTTAEKNFYAAYDFLEDHVHNRDNYIKSHMDQRKSSHAGALQSWTNGYSNLYRFKALAWEAVAEERLARDKAIAKRIGTVI